MIANKHLRAISIINEIIVSNIFLLLFCFVFSGQVDLWTKSISGCACSGSQHDTNNRNNNSLISSDLSEVNHHNGTCACCVKGGCQCGGSGFKRCAQCGLEQHCSNSKFQSTRF